MDRLGSKILKLLLVVGLFIYLVYHDISRGTFGVGTITGGIFLTSATYFIISLFGILLNLSRNYLITIVLTLILTYAFIFKMDELVASTFLTDEITAAIMCSLALICLAFDIKFIKSHLFPPKSTENQTLFYDEDADDFPAGPIPAKDARQALKENPEFMAQLSKDLEKRKGHKPTYEELINYIDNEALHLKSVEEIQQEVDELTERIKKQVRTENEQKRKQIEQ